MRSILEIIKHAGILDIIIYGLIINFGIYVCSLGLYSMLRFFPGKQQLGEKQPILPTDIFLSITTVFCNTLVFILGVYLWKYGFIRLDQEYSLLRVLAEVLLLTFTMDLLMYVFHRSVHFFQLL